MQIRMVALARSLRPGLILLAASVLALSGCYYPPPPSLGYPGAGYYGGQHGGYGGQHGSYGGHRESYRGRDHVD